MCVRETIINGKEGMTLEGSWCVKENESQELKNGQKQHKYSIHK